MLSIIIPTLNRGNLLTLTLNSLASQDFPPQNFEILIIDNGSTDNTKQVAERFIDQFPTLTVRYIFEPEPGLLSRRHRGALEAEGKILVFIDDDIEADRNWLKAIDSSFADPSVHLVGGRNLPKYETPPPDWLAWFWDKHEYGKFCGSLGLLDFGHQVREIDPEFVWGLNYSIRKDTLFVLSGFHPDCVPANLQQFQGDGETGLSIKAREKGYRAIYQLNALVFHHVSQTRMTYDYFDKRFFFQGVCDSYSKIRHQGYCDAAQSDRSFLQSLLKTVKTYLRAAKYHIKPLLRPETEESKLKQRFYGQYLAGYQFHQTAVQQNPALLAWVLRPDYWDYRSPAS